MRRPVHVKKVRNSPDDARLLEVETDRGFWYTRTIINATGTWTKPFIPYYPGIKKFRGTQFHTVTYPGPDAFRQQKVLVVGSGASAVQFIGALAGVANDILWATRTPPRWRATNAIDGLEAVTWAEDRVVRGEAPASVVAATGLVLRQQEQLAARMGFYSRWLPMPQAFTQDGAVWSSQQVRECAHLGAEEQQFDVILWATGFRPAIDHLAPLKLRNPRGGVQLKRVENSVQAATTAVVDERINFVGYGPSASSVGASRAAREAARAVGLYLSEPTPNK